MSLKRSQARPLGPSVASDEPPLSGARRRAPANRRSQRTEIVLDVAFCVPGGALEVGRTRDMSLDGAYIQTTAPAPFGSPVIMFLPLPGFAGLVEVRSVVRWSEKAGMGVQFGAMRARETHALIQMLTE